MVHPNVLKACGVDPTVYSGFAFGFGLERMARLCIPSTTSGIFLRMMYGFWSSLDRWIVSTR
ncbi:MAG: hypothetical protein R2682_11535 [Pyrinomonadaceae bacterium]